MKWGQLARIPASCVVLLLSILPLESLQQQGLAPLGCTHGSGDANVCGPAVDSRADLQSSVDSPGRP